MKHLIPFLFLVFLGSLCNACQDNERKIEPEEPTTGEEVRAVDISFLPELRTAGVEFKNQTGTKREALSLLKEAGVNTVRLRVWHTPVAGKSGLPEVKSFAKELKDEGFKVWLTVHYSDTWADPGKQTKPEAWKNLSTDVLKDSVVAYTRKIMEAIQPDYIQIGNEINGGLLWPTGGYANYATFMSLLKAGCQAVRAVNMSTKIMIHFAGVEFAPEFFSGINANAVDYDIAAVSYYPWWHGKDLTLIKNKLAVLSGMGKNIIIAETAYPFTLGWNDWTNNVVGLDNQLVSGYPATEEGQKNFLLKLRAIVKETPGGLGFAYWAPEWVAYKGSQAEDASTWENLCLFDFSNKALPALEAFEE